MRKEVLYPIATAILPLACINEKPEPIEKPNILFAISDDQSFQHTSFEDCTFVFTPAFDRIAEEGVYFTNCYAGSPGCAPSRSSIVTGRYHWQNEQSGQHASSWLKKYVPFIDLLDNNGYITGRTGKGVDPFQYARDENDSLWRATEAGGIEHSTFEFSEENDERTAKGIKNVNYFENFKYFVDSVANDEPFFFWFGAHEPHRGYEKDSWKRMGKKLKDVQVPGFLPDNEVVRGDLLDYAVEIEWFDDQLMKMIHYLEEIGELENTIIMVTGDNGMPFPRAKANCFEYGFHVPLAIRYPKKFPGSRVVDDPIGFIDFAPTILELTNTSSEGMQPIVGKSFTNILKSKKAGIVDKNRKFLMAGRERHSCSRYKNLGYPQRVIKEGDFIYIWNIKPDRWPAGAPQKYDPQNETVLLPMYGLDENGKFIRNSAFHDIDACPTKTYIIENHKDEEIAYYFKLFKDKYQEFEMYNVKEDPYCLTNLAGNSKYEKTENEMKSEMMKVLEETKDPRVVGPDKEIFDSYLRYSSMRKFPKPN